MTTLKLVIILCTMTYAYGQCFDGNQDTIADVPVTKLYKSLETFAPTIFKAAVYTDFIKNNINSNSTTNVHSSAWLGVMSAYSRANWYNINEEPTVILQSGAPQNEKHIFDGTVQSKSVDNILISPISIWFALMQTYFGARKNTSDELAKVLEIKGIDKNALGVAYQQFKSEFQNVSNHKNTLKIANKFYIFGRAIYTCVKKFFGSDVEIFGMHDYYDSTNKINAWVQEQTNGKIKTFLPVGAIYDLTCIILANAACFKGKWAAQFEVRKTYRAYFYQNALRKTSAATVNMMKKEHSYLYGQSSALHCTAVELFYEGNEISMLALLPYEDNSAEYLAASLTKANLDELYSDMYFQKMNLHFPKFRIEQSSILDDMLTSLGLKGLFIQGVSDLTGYNGNDELHLGQVQHRTFIEVDEQGAHPAFASAAQHLETFEEEQYPTVQFNHPFVFLIRHRDTNSILFTGLVRDPTI